MHDRAHHIAIFLQQIAWSLHCITPSIVDAPSTQKAKREFEIPVVLPQFTVVLTLFPIEILVYPAVYKPFPIVMPLIPIVLLWFTIVLYLFPVVVSQFSIVLSCIPIVLLQFSVMMEAINTHVIPHSTNQKKNRTITLNTF